MFEHRRASLSSGKSSSNLSSTLAGGLSEAESLDEKFTFSDKSKTSLLFSCFLTFCIALLAAGLIRSAVVLSDNVDRLAVLQKTSTKLSTFDAIETMVELINEESSARVKYLSSGFSATYYPGLTQAVNNIDTFYNRKGTFFRQIYFEVAAYQSYKCSTYGIRSNLDSRPEAVPLNQYRNLDERNLNAFDDADYYQCLMVQMAAILGQQVATATGLQHIWEEATAYYLSVRSLVNLYSVLNYAHLTRELILKKGLVNFARDSDSDNFDSTLSVAQSLLTYAKQMTAESIGDMGLAAVANLDYFVDQFSAINNASKALQLVSPDKFELTALGKATLKSQLAVKDQYRRVMFDLHNDEVATAYLSIVSEPVKIFILVIILLPLTVRSVFHMKNESIRMKWRYDTCVTRYNDSCKAIFRLLPEPVAKKLNQGLLVRPEFYHNVTILHSDIVGFTSICNRLTAIDVISMLNRIFITFDSRTNAYKCYKIETIGDAYVVASGVPTRNKIHATEIASLALALIEEVGMIKVPHASQGIRIRIGINSGPVIAGIVGIKMLRYCLFGKSVLLANRMEQTSQSQKIHLSFSSYLELEKHGGFLTTERPKEEWPDENPSFWLVGKTTTAVGLSLFGSPNEQVGKVEVILDQN